MLLAINQSWANPAFDIFFAWISSHLAFSLPLLSIVLVFFSWRFGMDGIKFWLLTVLFVFFGEQVGVVLKAFFEQARPCAELSEAVRQVNTVFPVGCSRSLNGMPSNHAITFFMFAIFSGGILRWHSWLLAFLLLAALVALSRIYLGLHYPSQVLVGALIGVGLGLIAVWLSGKYIKLIQRIQQAAR